MHHVFTNRYLVAAGLAGAVLGFVMGHFTTPAGSKPRRIGFDIVESSHSAVETALSNDSGAQASATNSLRLIPIKSDAPRSLMDANSSQVRAHRAALFEEALEAHRMERIDPIWSAQAASQLEGDLFALSEQERDFELIEVECKTQTCAAKIEWPSRGTAQRSMGKLIEHKYSYNCQRAIHLPESAERPYRAALLLKCDPEHRNWPIDEPVALP